MAITINDLLKLNLDERTWMRNLPHSLAEMMRVIGLEKTLKIALHYGGGSLFVPGLPWLERGNTSPLIELVGVDAVYKLNHYLCLDGTGSNFLIPACLHGRTWRRLRFLSLIGDGLPEREAAQLLGISRSTLYHWKKTYGEAA